MKKFKSLSLRTLPLALSVAMLIGNLAFNPLTPKAETDAGTANFIGDSALAANNTAAPAADDVIPDANQFAYQKNELAAFMHFGPNTFNEVEWGEHYGNRAPSDIFTLSEDFDAETLVKALKEAGFKSLIVTAKHHDGFCIWNSKYTDYDIASTNYKNGKGDILAEVSAACSKYDLNMGLYLSPWDIHEPSYGYYDKDHHPTTKDNDALDYNDYYNNQLEEILSNPIYGNKGHFIEVWMDGAKGSGANAQEYDFIRWFKTIQKYEGKAAGLPADAMLFGAQAYTAVRWIGNENGLAAKDTWSKSKVNIEKNTINSNFQGSFTVGFEDGNKWTVPEADARITSHWFWGTKKNTPKSLEDLAYMYFNSVGHNATLLLNIPPNNRGKIDEPILNRLKEFGENIKQSFAQNLAASAIVTASNVRGNDLQFKPGNVLDNNNMTYWTTDDGHNSGTLLLNLGGTKTFDIISVEEAIQLGQHINSYKIEYRNGNAEWQTADSGVTIGAKRLVRLAPVKADQIRITVSAPSGKVPMISKVGVFKASQGFALAGAAPSGMNVIDINDPVFHLSKGWHDENGGKFVNGTNKWANKGASFELTFTGSKVYLIGTKDPNHGEVEIYIDGQKVDTVNTAAGKRSVGQILYESPTLTQGEHTIRAVVKTKALGVEAAYVINNNEKGMIGIENPTYTMNEDESLQIKLFRVGGEKEAVTVTLSPNPGTAIQGDFDTEAISEITFAPGETMKTATVTTKRNINRTGNRNFTVELSTTDPDLILGFNPRALITINDKETAILEELRQLVTDGNKSVKEWYQGSFNEYKAAVAEGGAVLDNTEATGEKIEAAIAKIKTALSALTPRSQYNEEDRFHFPDNKTDIATLEAEFGILHDEKLSSDGIWALQINEAKWASFGKFVNCINQRDTVSYPYTANVPGTYLVTATYRSGSNSNKLAWSEPDNKITAGTTAAGSNNASVTRTVEFEMVVNEKGNGTLVFTGPDGKSPQLDKLTFKLKEAAEPLVTAESTTTPTEAETKATSVATTTETSTTTETTSTEAATVATTEKATTAATTVETSTSQTTATTAAPETTTSSTVRSTSAPTPSVSSAPRTSPTKPLVTVKNALIKNPTNKINPVSKTGQTYNMLYGWLILLLTATLLLKRYIRAK